MIGKSCDICGEEHFEGTKSCKSCNTIINRYRKCTIGEVRSALTKAYSGTVDGTRYFKCHYTDVESKFNTEKKSLDPIEDALILTIDHTNPTSKSKRGEVVVSLYIVNQIKGKISPDDFKNIITVLAECLNDKTNQNSKKFENILLAIQNQRK